MSISSNDQEIPRPSPLQNRVTPWGSVIADAGRGMFLGNRGCLVDEAFKLATRRWRLRAWITCQLSYKGWWRPVMQPGVWTELFFLDDASALAAGHRPCGLCRRADYNHFVESWQAGQGLNRRPKVIEIDDVMHRERTRRDRSKVIDQADAEHLPDGVMIVDPTAGNTALILMDNRSAAWSASGYRKAGPRPDGIVEVLTPASSVSALSAGFVPQLHTSLAAALS
ncbi:MAG: hypothetical protein P8Q36_00425 [Alphaproteobacteria bacterium]|jgi:hypothetical protein|nr:hypothetical protein [Rhodospirillaceae bacterium]MDG2479322.1 hypothetical protein [Alphaproteobacteria bacterium]